MKIWLDDERPMPAGWDKHVKTYQDAVNAIEMGKVTHIGFDHDLGDENDKEIRNGYQVAKHIEELAYFGCIPRIIWSIQSANPPGRKNIEACMRNADKYWDIHEAKVDETGVPLLVRHYGYIESINEEKKTFSFRFKTPEGSDIVSEFYIHELSRPTEKLSEGTLLLWVVDVTEDTSTLYPLECRYTKAELADAAAWVKEFGDKGWFDDT